MEMVDISTRAFPNAVVLVDDADAHYLRDHKWTPDASGYAHRKVENNKKVYLHRLIAGAQRGETVDHINRNRHDNTRGNLRIVTRSENCRNRSGVGSSRYLGVHAKRDRWQAEILVAGTRWALGSYTTPEEAAAAYDDALAHFGLLHLGQNLPGRAPTPREPTKRLTAPHGFPGVRRTSSGRWGVRILKDGRRFSIGTFDTAEEAARTAKEYVNG